MNIVNNKQELLRKEVQLRGRIQELESQIARFDTEQMAVKILLNSMYGALG